MPTPTSVDGKKVRAAIARRNGGRQKINRKRESIEILFGPSVADMLNRPGVYAAIEKFANAKIGSELQRQLTVALRG